MYRQGTTLDEFIKELTGQIQEILKQDYGVDAEPRRQTALKTNTEVESVCFKFPDSPAAPSIYPEQLYKQQYQNGDSVETIAKQSASAVYNAYKMTPPMPELTIEEGKKHITLNVVNTEKNAKLLETTPHVEIGGGDLSAIPRWYINDEASFIVSNQLAASMNLTPTEVLQMGQKNVDSAEYEAKSMREILLEQMGLPADTVPDVGPEMIVLTVPSHVQGARALLSERALDDVHERIGDFVVLPSSIHEVICIPSDGMDPDALRSMVNEVNANVVDEQDYLSSNIMVYRGESLELVGASLEVNPVQDDMSFDNDMHFGMGG